MSSRDHPEYDDQQSTLMSSRDHLERDDQQSDDQQHDDQESDILSLLSSVEITGFSTVLDALSSPATSEHVSQGRRPSHAASTSSDAVTCEVQEDDSTEDTSCGSGGVVKTNPADCKPEHKHVRQYALDLELKLEMANRGLEESKKKRELKASRALEAEAELRSQRQNCGGSDLQHQLMGQLVGVRERCRDLEVLRTEESSKTRAIEDKLKGERRQRELAQKEYDQIKKESSELMAKVKEIKAGDGPLCAQEERSLKEMAVQKRDLDVIAAERDETLVLLEKAMTQKEITIKLRQRDVDEKRRQVILLEENLQQDQEDIRLLLHQINMLLREVERRGKHQRPDTLHELLRIRDGMYMLTRKKTIIDLNSHSPNE